MNRDLKYIDGAWQCKIVTPLWQELNDVPVGFETDGLSEPSAGQVEAINQLVDGIAVAKITIDLALKTTRESILLENSVPMNRRPRQWRRED